ncbi:unnamed protein product [Linum trigynum]|uniref:Uncharacterized protein n=1 Tax=Linum trigynum TaxID=586398 RepID=A0AAV2CIZ2_9ROSI
MATQTTVKLSSIGFDDACLLPFDDGCQRRVCGKTPRNQAASFHLSSSATSPQVVDSSPDLSFLCPQVHLHLFVTAWLRSPLAVVQKWKWFFLFPDPDFKAQCFKPPLTNSPPRRSSWPVKHEEVPCKAPRRPELRPGWRPSGGARWWRGGATVDEGGGRGVMRSGIDEIPV